jgi:hypothetical protein
LVAYCLVNFYGEISKVGDILGHKLHLHNGVMNLLVWGTVRSIMEARPWCRGLNYLYAKSWPGVMQFKKHMGFASNRTLVTLAPPDIARAVQRSGAYST